MMSTYHDIMCRNVTVSLILGAIALGWQDVMVLGSLFKQYNTNFKIYLSDLTAHHIMLLNKRKYKGKKIVLNSINCGAVIF